MKIISVANHKGGVSKTCTVHNLGKALSLKKKNGGLLDKYGKIYYWLFLMSISNPQNRF